MASPYLLHRDPRYYESPEQFLPERWRGVSPNHYGPFVPFGVGARTCLGRDFVTVLLTVVLAVLCRQWRIVTFEPVSWRALPDSEVMPDLPVRGRFELRAGTP